jgi:hypothetical protein
MNARPLSRYPMATAVWSAVAVLAGASGLALSYGQDPTAEESLARRGLEIAPVPLDLGGKDRELVGLGSYLVNAVASCNMCHSAGPATEFAPGGNPYYRGNLPKVVNQSTYLGGGRTFAPQLAGNPAVVSRNLTPDKTGRPAGLSFAAFLHVMRTGEDPDHVHPNCSAAVTTNCFPTSQPYNGDLLQVMPWPEFQSMTEHSLLAIYEYLSAIPCIEGPPGILHNECT